MFAIDRHAYEPIADPLEIRNSGVLKLGMTIRTEDKQVSGVMADMRVKVMQFKVRFAISFLESE